MTPSTNSDEHTPLLAPKSRRTPDQMTRAQFAMLMIGVWSLAFIGALDGTIVATLLSTIGSSFNAMQLSSWVGTSYLLSVCCFTPLYGRLCNILGRRTSIMFACTLFGVGTVCCAFAQSMVQLIIIRCIAGIGGGGLTVVGSVIVSDAVPLKSRGLYQGFTNLLFGLGGAVGAPLGGWLGDTIGWRAAFLVQAPVLATAITLLYFQVREPVFITSSSTESAKDRLARIDFAGCGLLTTSLVTLVIALTIQNAARLQWSDARVSGLLASSFIALAIFVYFEVKYAKEPILDMRMLRRRTPGFVAANNFLIAVLSFSTLYNVPLYFTATLLRSSADAGKHLIPNSAAVAVGSLFGGWYMRKTGRYWTIQALASLGIVFANVALSHWQKDTREWVYYLTLAPNGFGFALVLTTTLLALIASVEREDIPLATGTSYLFRTTGQVLGVSLSSALTQSVLQRHLRARIIGPGSREIIDKILDSTKYIHTLPEDLKKHATESWAIALKTLFVCQIGLAVLIFLTLIPVEELALPDTLSGPLKPPAGDEEASLSQ